MRRPARVNAVAVILMAAPLLLAAGILLAARLRVAEPGPAPADAAADLKAVVEKALRAAEADKLRGVTAWTETVTTKTTFGSTTVYTTHVQLPDRVRQEGTHDTGGMKESTLSVYNGGKGWWKGKDGKVNEMLADRIPKSPANADFRRVLAVVDPDAEVSLLLGRMVGDRAADVVRVARPGRAAEVFLFDRATGRLLRWQQTRPMPDGKEFTSVEECSDYREVDGVPVAHIRRRGTGRFQDESRVELKFVGQHDPKLFEKPE